MMSSLVLLLCVCLSEYYVVSEKLSAAVPVDIKFTKLMDVKLESPSRTSSLSNDIGRFLYPQTDNIGSETREDYFQVPLKLSFGIDKQNAIQEYEKPISSVFDQCKYLVGRSQLPICRLNPVAKNSENNYYPRSCREILETGNNKSGVYLIKPRTSNKPFAVLCDMETKGGGWTHIQKRFDGSQDFYLPWRDYKIGFGDLNSEFWIGLENIYHMTEGAWWYNNCHNSNLNGKFMTVVLPEAYLAHGLNWYPLKTAHVNLAGSRMMIRPIGA
uniref:Techylectin-5B-like n=1 Tax=Diabrotica virgifera virgifera TaxID=50390 RepID=A0A6P7G244_DIAVI